MYLEGKDFRGIERLTSIHHTTVMEWVKNLTIGIKKLRPELSYGKVNNWLDYKVIIVSRLERWPTARIDENVC